jgi:hypothetical protein
LNVEGLAVASATHRRERTCGSVIRVVVVVVVVSISIGRNSEADPPSIG